MTYSIIQVKPILHEKEILQIWKDNLINANAKKYKLVYKNNPYGPSWGWLASSENMSEFVGFTGLCARRIIVNDKTITAGVAIDFAINKEHRGLGPALKLQRAVTSGYKEKGFDFIYGFPNQQAASVFKRIGYRTIGEMTRWVKVLRSEYKIKEFIKSEIISRTVSFIIDPIISKTLRERRYKRPEEFKIEMAKSFDRRFDILWEMSRDQFKIIGERTSEFLTWRYGWIPKGRFKVFCLLDGPKKNLLGYVIYWVKNNFCYVLDLLTKDLEKVLDLLLLEFIKYMRKEGFFAISISYFGNNAVLKKLKEWGFIQRKERRTIMIFAGNNCHHLPYLLNIENWHLLEGDDI